MRGEASRRWRVAGAAAGAALLVAALGGTITNLGPWYAALEKPPWQPPDIAFPLAWTVIYALTAASGVMAWLASRERVWREWVIGLFALNGFLNLFWSFLFFRLHRPDWAFLEVFALLSSILALIVFLWPRTKIGALLLAPYVVWVCFAAALNWAIIVLNGPFVP